MAPARLARTTAVWRWDGLPSSGMNAPSRRSLTAAAPRANTPFADAALRSYARMTIVM